MTGSWQALSQAYIKGHEGLRLEMYRCPNGYPTIGYGHLIRRDEMPRYKDRMITPEEAEAIFHADWDRAVSDARKVVPTFDELSDPRKIVLVDMSFQLGIMGLLTFQRMLKAIRRMNFVEAAAQILDSKYAREDSPSRAYRNAKMMLED